MEVVRSYKILEASSNVLRIIRTI